MDDLKFEGNLRKTGQPFVIKSLAKEDGGKILALQDVVFQTLSETEKTYLKLRSRDFIDAHFADNGAVIGALSEGRLIGQAIIHNPTPVNPDTGMVDMEPVGAPDKMTVLQAVSVHPEYRGNRLMQKMVRYWLQHAHKAGRTHAIAEIAARNHYSWRVFVREGLNIVGIGVDEEDGTRVYNAYERVDVALSMEGRKITPAEAQYCPKAELDKQKKLIEQGYVGVDYDDKQKTMIMMSKSLNV